MTSVPSSDSRKRQRALDSRGLFGYHKGQTLSFPSVSPNHVSDPKLGEPTIVMMAMVVLLAIRGGPIFVLVLLPAPSLHLANVLLLERQTDRLPMYV